VRCFTIRREYHPVQPGERDGTVRMACDPFPTAVLHQALPVDEIERRVSFILYAQTGSYQAGARLLKLNWRTLRARIQPLLRGRRIC
jgi:hypothetical protein